MTEVRFLTSPTTRVALLAVLAMVVGTALAASGVRQAAAAPGTCNLSSDEYNVTEGNTLNVTILRSGGTEDAYVSYSITDPTASGGGGLSPTLGIATIFGNNTSKVVPIDATDNAVKDGPRSRTITIDDNVLAGQEPCVIGLNNTATVYIMDDDGPQVSSISPRSGSATGNTLVTITGSGFAGVDCNAAPMPVKFGAIDALSCTVVNGSSITAESPAGAATTTVDVRVTTPDGQTPNTAADNFTYGAGPIVHSLDPASGDAGQTTLVTIEGEDFTGIDCDPSGGLSVEFGNVDAVSCTFVSDTQITATAPAQSVGTYDVIVTIGAVSSPNTTDDDFTYTGDLPVVTSLSPNSGPVAGGTTVTIKGQNLSGTTAVSFGTESATSIVNVNSTTVTAVSPGQAGIGTVNVQVTTPSGNSDTTGSGDNFTYTNEPSISGLNPDHGPTGGNNAVIISGTNLLGVTEVTFGGVDALDYIINSANQITATAPPHALGTVNVRVTNASGISDNTPNDDYEYIGGPNITAISPTGGPVEGGTNVTITGSGFTGATNVDFGGVNALDFDVINDTRIDAESPPHSLGTVFVHVTAPGGTSANANEARFTYGLPSVTELTPSSGPKVGGNFVTIEGSNFIGATDVFFGPNESPAFQVTDSETINAQVPPGNGTVHVRVETDAGLSAATDDDEYTYNPLPVIDLLTPDRGPAAGGNTVIITGTDFTGATSVAFGSTAATSFNVTSDTRISAVAPAGTPGTVNVRVITPEGTSPVSDDTVYTYESATGTITYNLSFRWNLITWGGPHGLDIFVALQSLDGNSQTTSIMEYVTALYCWDGMDFQRFFPDGVNIPGANTLTQLQFGQACWLALSEARQWVIPSGP